jgi:hypothetical protein
MSGRLGAEDLVPLLNTFIYIVPDNKISTFNISVCNRNSEEALIRLATVLPEVTVPTVKDYIEYDVELAANQVLERTGIVLQSKYSVYAYSNISSVTVQIWGWEESV